MEDKEALDRIRSNLLEINISLRNVVRNMDDKHKPLCDCKCGVGLKTSRFIHYGISKMIEFEEKLYLRVMSFNFIIALILALIYLVLFGIIEFSNQEYLSHAIIFFGAFGFNMLLIGIFFSKKKETK